MYLLLDTNILLDLLIKGREEYLIDQFETLQNLKLVQFLVPKTLKEEWKKKRDQTIGSHKKSAVEFGKLSPGNEGYMDDLVAVMEEKAERIDILLEKGIQIPLSNKTMLKVSKDISNDCCHFLAKSLKDALIYFATIDYLQKKRISEYILITNNGTDFGDNGTKSKDIHPNLKIDGINCVYLTAASLFFHRYKEHFNTHFEQVKNDHKPGSAIKVIRKEGKNLLLYLYDVLKLCEAKMAFMPLEILSRIYPFRTQSLHHNYSYYEGFTIHTNNKELFEIFTAVDLKTMRFKGNRKFRNTKENLAKLEYVYLYLNRHYIVNLSLIGEYKTVDIEHPKLQKLYKPPPYYEGYNWQRVTDVIDSKVISPQRAHLLFQLGFYAKAFNLYFDLYKRSQKEKNKVGTFILLHNLKAVSNFLNLRGIEDTSPGRREIEGLDTDKEYFGFARSTRIDESIARFVKNAEDMEYYGQKISKDLSDIHAHYESQLKANYSSNNNYDLLVNHFAIFERYTLVNALAYTRYSDFQKTCSAFIKGIFFAHGLNKYQSKRLEYFDGFHMEVMSMFGQPKEMLLWYNRYITKEIPYKKTDGAFEKMLLSHFSTSSDTLDKILKSEPTYLSIEFYRITWNLLLLVSLVQTNEKLIMQVWQSLPLLLSRMHLRERLDVNNFAIFLKARNKEIGKKELVELFWICINNPGLHHDTIFQAFGSISVKRKIPLVSAKEEYDILVPLFLEKCSKCGKRHKGDIYSLYKILSPELQIELRRLIETSLREKADFDLLYKASLFGVIQPHEFIQQYIEAFEKPTKSRNSFLEGEILLQGVNEMINILFTYEIEIPATLREKVKDYSPYYDWLTDMNGFDYSKFEPLWVMQYATTAYMKRIFSFESVRKALAEYLKWNYQPTLAMHYPQIVK